MGKWMFLRSIEKDNHALYCQLKFNCRRNYPRLFKYIWKIYLKNITTVI